MDSRRRANKAISWDVYGKVDNVRIDYTRGGTGSWSTIVTSADAEAGDAAANKGAYNWTLPTDPSDPPGLANGDYITRFNTNGKSSMIRIFDADTNFDDFVQDDSDGFIVKGRLTITQPASVAGGLNCGSLQTIEWQRDGRINAVNVRYSIDGGSTYPYTIGQLDRAFADDSALTQTTASQWPVPETPMVTSYRLIVEDTEYEKDGTAGTFVETTNFRVKGALHLTAPLSIATWRILEQKTISWTVKHGNMDKVKIMASPNGTFSDAYSIAPAGTIDAFSAGDGFSEAKLPTKVGSGSYLWTIPVDTALVTTMKFKVVQEDTGFTDIESDNQSASIEIRPSITVNTPGSDWTEGATNKSITFTVNGTYLNTVYVFLYDPDDTVEHRLDASGVTTTGSGNPQQWGPGTFTVPDAKSLSCTVRVSDTVLAGNAKVQGESGDVQMLSRNIQRSHNAHTSAQQVRRVGRGID